MDNPGKHPGGRPTKYDVKLCELAHRLAANGATDIEIADELQVHPATYYRWKAEHQEFREATALGKDAADDRVEASLYHRATGYSHEAVKIFMPAGSDQPVVVPYREHYPPDTAAASLWLRNRRSDKWRDKQDFELSGRVDFTNMTDAEIEIELAARLAEIGASTGAK